MLPGTTRRDMLLTEGGHSTENVGRLKRRASRNRLMLNAASTTLKHFLPVVVWIYRVVIGSGALLERIGRRTPESAECTRIVRKARDREIPGGDKRRQFGAPAFHDPGLNHSPER